MKKFDGLFRDRCIRQRGGASRRRRIKHYGCKSCIRTKRDENRNVDLAARHDTENIAGASFIGAIKTEEGSRSRRGNEAISAEGERTSPRGRRTLMRDALTVTGTAMIFTSERASLRDEVKSLGIIHRMLNTNYAAVIK